MAIRGFSINISEQLTSNTAQVLAQWIGGANVVRNAKIREYQALLSKGKGDSIGQAYSYIRKDKDLAFLKLLPVQIARNAASMVFADVTASRKGLRKFPKIKNKHKKRSVVITSELFMLEALPDGRTQFSLFSHAKKGRQKLLSVTLPYLPEQLSKQFRISRQGRYFTLSGSYQSAIDNPTNEALLEDFSHLSEEDIFNNTTGIDRGVIVAAFTSDGAQYHYNPNEVASIKRALGRKAHYQRILARKKRNNKNKSRHKCESNRQRKLQAKISLEDKKLADIRQNFCHQASRQIVTEAKSIITLEDLTIKNMTRRAKPKRNKSGRGYVRNRARAKSGLNRSMLNVSLARLGTYIKYKANDACKATLEIPPYNSSRECHVCHKTNTIRPQQDTLICLNGCGTFHADQNAGKVLQYRTIKYIKERKFADKAKPRKTIINRKKTLVSELTSVKKSGMIEVVSHDTPPGRYGTQAGIRPSSEGISRGKIKSCLEQRTGPSSVLETR